ncbi:MAG: septum formation initiator family protein [Candidatus Marinimicrobia bacterium]|nr:septum formation initiator family protein [Candidatus Neomarinimicrobiota bacterium]MBT3632800.1 septum formation initiator family protein [Candidatus Neomarinimicrobiota bacterium]MBT3681910.1 septum formation initiator family protein [Candidatus Neomarinimicrobiota bacterium]MBT3759061.1 septum formation initiator family protein [Candidatus Neomarinimicrobiota bacterium]MBT3895040.1 septum formation initiator family protein [Candidatus Neomarinimicrobiota bacterium]
MPVRRNKRQSKSALPFIIGAAFVALLILLFSDLGLIRWFHLNKEHNKLITEIKLMKEQRIQLKTDKDRLENDLEYIEQLAREKFRMVKPGEKVFRVRDNRTVEDTKK